MRPRQHHRTLSTVRAHTKREGNDQGPRLDGGARAIVTCSNGWARYVRERAPQNQQRDLAAIPIGERSQELPHPILSSMPAENHVAMGRVAVGDRHARVERDRVSRDPRTRLCNSFQHLRPRIGLCASRSQELFFYLPHLMAGNVANNSNLPCLGPCSRPRIALN